MHGVGKLAQVVPLPCSAWCFLSASFSSFVPPLKWETTPHFGFPQIWRISSLEAASGSAEQATKAALCR